MKILARQFSLFTLVGGFATLVHYALLIGLVQFAAMSALYASMAGYAAGALVNYALNRSITFTSTRDHRETLWRFLTIAAVGFMLNALLMSCMLAVLQAHYLVAQTASTLVVLMWNFIGNRYWTFRESVSPARRVS